MSNYELPSGRPCNCPDCPEVGVCATCGWDADDGEIFCPKCLAGVESSEHFEKCGAA